MSYFKISVIAIFSIGIMALSLSERTISPPKYISPKAPVIADGRQLAQIYCQRCHAFPDPSLLDKQTWVQKVLPNMAMRLGVKVSQSETLEPLPAEEEKIVKALNIYPETALISQSEWQQIVEYYEREAPAENLPQKKVDPISEQLPLFAAKTVTLEDKPVSQITLLKYDKGSSQLYVGDAQNSLYVIDKDFKITDKWWLDTAPTDIDFPKNAPPRILTIGIFSPSDQKLGRLMTLTKSTVPNMVNIAGLPRPVSFSSSDLNMDGKEDAIICGFGNYSGKLFWLDNFDPNKEHILKDLPGARNTVIKDLNGDKKPDIVALMAQGREGMSIFYNLGNGKFREKEILTFSPVFGASYFEMADFNKDGFQDILLANGDNWDYSSVNKNYHGIRIYLNDGKDNFKEAWFYPMYGAAKALARDFDGDGDLDIAATSFYNDLEHPEQGFLYFSNQGNLKFNVSSTPEAALGKWLTMEAADIDQDGDTDIILGSYFQNIGEVTKLMFRGATSFPQLLILENKNK